MYEYFPATVYNDVLITDTLKRFKLSEKFKKSVAVQNYRVKEEDTPESLSYLLYKNTTFSWMILLINDIMDRNNEWPSSYSVMMNKIQQKYDTSSIFLYDSDICTSTSCIPMSEITHFVVDGDTYEVRSTDRNINKLVTKQKLPYSVQAGDPVSFYIGSTLVKTSTLRRVVYEDSYSLHHFEDENGEYIDPRSSTDGGPYTQTNTYLYQYINSGDLSQPLVISNFDYEMKQNDAKRDILLILPEYQNAVLSGVSRMFLNGTSKNSNVLEVDPSILLGEA